MSASSHALQKGPGEVVYPGPPTARASLEGSQAQDALGKTEMAVVAPTKSPAPGEAGLRGPN
jgi:hypothetical protein